MSKTLYMLIGLSGSGKSTWAQKYAFYNKSAIFSSDAYRKLLLGDETDQSNNNKVFTHLHKDLLEYLQSDSNACAIYDATNLSYKRRKEFLSYILPDVHKCAIVFATVFERCVNNNERRERVVPPSILERQLRQFEFPCYWEGFDSIQVLQDTFSNYEDFLMTKSSNFDQKTKYHSLNLHEHHINAWLYSLQAKSCCGDVIRAAQWHDIGKLFTQSFDDKGPNAHYYNHENVSAYLTAQILKPQNIIDACGLITHHMKPYTWKEEKTRQKYRSLMGEEFYQNLMMLHEADLAAH